VIDLIRATTPSQRTVVLGACVVGLVLGGLGIFFGLTKEKSSMAMTTTTSVQGAAIPPIDASAPTKTETATFALG
jgi:hypothetical protein